jgi:AraC-like DNA-binding protein
MCLSLVHRAGGLSIAGKSEVPLSDGCTLIHAREGGKNIVRTQARWYSVVVPRATIAPLVHRDADRALAGITRNSASALLRAYIDSLTTLDEQRAPTLDVLAANHIRDLASLIVGANNDGVQQAKSGGVVAARLQAAKRFVAQHLLEPELSDRMVATYLGVSPRYVATLFAQDGGFHNYLIGERLAWGYRLLTNPVHAHLKVIDIAFRCGFTSLPTFNRQFKKKYGFTPSEAREAMSVLEVL